MSRLKKQGTALAMVSSDPVSIFGKPPILSDEDRGAYDALLGRILGAIKPADIFEEIWVREIAYHVWEVLRLQRLKASLLMATAYRGLKELLQAHSASLKVPKCCERWAQNDPAAIEEVNEMLANAGLTMDEVMAVTLANNMDHIERIHRMLIVEERRRDEALAELDRRRAKLAQNLRRVVQNLEPEFQVVEPNSQSEKGAA